MQETVYKFPGPAHFTLALLADSHNTDPTPILASLRRHTPDIICIAGDFLIGHRPETDDLIVQTQENVLKLITGCVKIAKTYVSLGNHEWMICEEDIALLEQTGATVLDNRYVVSSVGGQRIAIGGLTSAIVTHFQKRRSEEGVRYPYRARSSRPANLRPNAAWLAAFAEEPGYKLLLSHHPEYWALQEPFLSERRIDLVLSGHAHGGQIRLLGRGLYAPGQGLLPKFTDGIFQGTHGAMAVSRGLANLTRIPRLFNPTEIVYMEVSEEP